VTAAAPDPQPGAGRDAELAIALAAVRRRIADACAQAGRDPSTVTLVAVTKTRPAADVLALLRLGVRDLGENRDQEAAAKVAAVDAALAAGVTGPPGSGPPGSSSPGGRPPDSDPGGRPPDSHPGGSGASAGVADRGRWHLVGQLQTNKVRSVAHWADVVESVDRLRLVTALDDAAAAAGRVLDCLVQVDLAAVDPDSDSRPGTGRSPGASGAGRGGASPASVPELAAAIAAAGSLRLRGVMAVAPLGVEPTSAFAALARVAAGVRSEHPDADVVSAGMSGDLEAAVAAGATQVRIGSSLLGSRPPLH